MSAYSDWKCGAITGEQYRDHEAYEARRDKYLEDMKFAEAFGHSYDEWGEDEEDDD